MRGKPAALCLALAAIAGSARAGVPDMYLVQADHDTMTVVDRGSMVQVAPTIRRVDVHTFYSHPLQSNGVSIQHLERVKEFDCATHMHRTTFISGYTVGDQLANSHPLGLEQGAAWTKIEPDSNERLDERSICHPPVAARHLAYESGQQMYADYLNTIVQHGGR
jgi:hypothetical protein